jgi:hypothetical protein
MSTSRAVQRAARCAAVRTRVTRYHGSPRREISTLRRGGLDSAGDVGFKKDTRVSPWGWGALRVLERRHKRRAQLRRDMHFWKWQGPKPNPYANTMRDRRSASAENASGGYERQSSVLPEGSEASQFSVKRYDGRAPIVYSQPTCRTIQSRGRKPFAFPHDDLDVRSSPTRSATLRVSSSA